MDGYVNGSRAYGEVPPLWGPVADRRPDTGTLLQEMQQTVPESVRCTGSDGVKKKGNDRENYRFPD